MVISSIDTGRKYTEADMGKKLEYLLCSRPTMSRTRLRHLGASLLKGLEEVSKLDIKVFLNLVRSVP